MHNINGQVPLHDQHGYSESDGAVFFVNILRQFLLILLIKAKILINDALLIYLYV